MSAAVVLVAGSLATAFAHGKEHGHTVGFATGKEHGHTVGFAKGKDIGHKDGYTKGLSQTDGYNAGYFRGKAEFAGQYAAGYTNGEQSAKCIKDSLVFHEGFQVGLAEHSRLRAQAASV